MQRLAIGLLAAILGAAVPIAASAADAARRDIIGFSPDGTYFAFEEWGVQDGSGFPYSNVYIIDNRIDEWVPGSPFRALLQGDWAKPDQARSQARNAASGMLVQLGIGRKGRVVLSDPAEKLEAAARFLAFTVPDEANARGLGTVRLRITEHQLNRAGCSFGNQLRGFVLQLEDAQGAPIRILHEDKDIPPSRGCPKGYGLSDVIVYPREGRGPVLIVIVSVYRFGFEGVDRRFIGIGTAFDKNPQAAAAAPVIAPGTPLPGAATPAPIRGPAVGAAPPKPTKAKRPTSRPKKPARTTPPAPPPPSAQ